MDEYERSEHREKNDSGRERNARELDEGIRRVVERARARGDRIRGPGPVTVRHVDPALLRPAEPAPVTRTPIEETRRRGLTPRECQNPTCGKTFTPTSPSQKFCSVPCRNLRPPAEAAPDDTPPAPGDDAPERAQVSGTGNEPESEAADSPGRPGPASRQGASPPVPPPEADELVERYLERLFDLTDPESIVAKEVKVTALDKLDAIVHKLIRP